MFWNVTVWQDDHETWPDIVYKANKHVGTLFFKKWLAREELKEAEAMLKSRMDPLVAHHRKRLSY